MKGATSMKLTDAKVKDLLKRAQVHPPAKREMHADGHVDGLSLRITPNAHASWSVEYTRPGAKRENGPRPNLPRARFTIGPAAGSGAVSLRDARPKAEDIRARARNGEDPHHDEVAARKRAEQAAQQVTAGTVADLVEKMRNSREAKSWRPATVASWESLLRKYIIPSLGKVEAAEVTRAQVRALMDHVHGQTKIGSNRVFEVLRALFNWARSKDLVTTSPCDGIKKIEKEVRRERTYTDEELRTIVEAVKGTDDEDLFGFILRTATRSHETRAARLRDIDRDRRLWVIPAENAKAGRKHEVPLCPGAWSIIKRRFEKDGAQEYVFPGATGPCSVCEQKGHMGAPLNRRLRALSIAAGFLRNVGTEENPAWEGEPIRLHDIRRTVADRMLNVLGVAPHVVDLGVLAHAPAGLIGTYMPSGVGLPEKQAAMAAWDAHLDQILAGETKRRASVTAISKGRRRA